MNKSMDNPIDEFALYGDLRPDEHLSGDDLANLRAELFGPGGRATHDEAPLREHLPSNEVPIRTVTHIEPHQRQHARRRMLVGLAAAVVMLGVAGIVITAQRSPHSITGIGTPASSVSPPDPNTTNSTPTPATTETTATTATPEESQIATPVQNSADLSGRTMFMVPDYLPAGWHVNATAAGDRRPEWSQLWAQVDADGNVTGLVLVFNPGRWSGGVSDQTPIDVTVRGQAGQYFEDHQVGDQGENILTWLESGWTLEVRGYDSAKDLVRQVAESLTFDPQTGTIDFPAAESMGLIARSDLGFVDPNALQTSFYVGPSAIDDEANIASRPNRLGLDLKELGKPAGGNWTETIIDGRTVIRLVGPEETYTIWLDQGMAIQLQTKSDLPDDELAKIVHGIRFTDAAEYESVVLAMRQRTTAELSQWAEFDQATIPAGPTMPSEFSNGLTVSLRTRPGGKGANAMCLGSPVIDCAVFIGASGPASSVTSGGSSITVGGREIGAIWVSNALDNITGTPEIEPNHRLSPMQSGSDATDGGATTASIVGDVSTSTGRFVILSWPTDEHPPTVVFPNAEGGSGVVVTLGEPSG